MGKKSLITAAVLLIVAVIIYVVVLGTSKNTVPKINGGDIEFTDSNKVYHKIYTEKEFNALKSENKALYDSLKGQKDIIDYLASFKYEKEYSSGKVHTTANGIRYDEPKDFVYTSEANDSFDYKLTVNSTVEPNYYMLDVKTKEKFTIINKGDKDGNNHTTIQGDHKGDITETTVFKKKQKTKFKDRFSIGPSVTAGYDPINKNFGIMVGASITFKLN